jgi:hypothetical protein
MQMLEDTKLDEICAEIEKEKEEAKAKGAHLTPHSFLFTAFLVFQTRSPAVHNVTVTWQ